MKTNPLSETLQSNIQSVVKTAYLSCGYDPELSQVVESNLPEMAHYQCNGAFAASKKYQTSPFIIAQNVVKHLHEHIAFSKVSVAKPGFINMFIADEYILKHIEELFSSKRINVAKAKHPEKIILDYGGANIAKPLHVGHLRSAIIGESLKRIGRFLGHEIISDVHLGDWGLQMGMILLELSKQFPNLLYFDIDFDGQYPKDSPVNITDLDCLYPIASKKAKEDESVMGQARQATVELQKGRPGYRALWKHFVHVSVTELKKDYTSLGVEFDLWLGESDAHESALLLIKDLLVKGIAKKSNGALVIEIDQKNDAKEIPPLLLLNSEGALLYGATDLATIQQRVQKYDPDRIIYVVDKRQALHFEQVFQGALQSNILHDKTHLEHINFGTMNGIDNKPFKTRAGGVMKLRDLIAMIIENARKRLKDLDNVSDYEKHEEEEVARMVGIATLKFADLSNYRSKNYVFDVERFSSFDGRTGPYLLYNTVRALSILRKASEQSMELGEILIPKTPSERDLLLKLLGFSQAIHESWEERAPSVLCEYVYDLATHFSRFYHECPVLSEEDLSRRASRLSLVKAVSDISVQALDLLGIEVPKRM